MTPRVRVNTIYLKSSRRQYTKFSLHTQQKIQRSVKCKSKNFSWQREVDFDF